MIGDSPFRVGDWLVEPALDRISGNHEVLHLRPQVMAMLIYLAQRPGQLVTADELLDKVWTDKIVTDGSVYNCVSELRAALSDDSGTAPNIETIPRKGYRLVAPVEPESPDARQGMRGWRIHAVSTMVLVTVAVIGILIWFSTRSPQPQLIHSIAVLPLDLHSPNPARDVYFSDGMTEAIIARLGRLPELKVISRTSAMKLKGSSLTIPQIADTLDVDAVIEGSALIAGDEVRITLQLIDGETDSHVWTNTYVRDLDDILLLQEQLARTIATELHIKLIDDASLEIPAANPPTTNPEAYRAFLKGRYFFSRFGEENFRTALMHYQNAIELDPEFALAYASLAETCMQPLILVNGIRTLEQCAADARHAKALDANLADARAVLGFIHFLNWEWESAKEELERGLELDPNAVTVRQWRAAVFRATFQFDNALEELKIAEELDPLNLFVGTMVGWPLYDMGRYEEALAQWDDVLEMDPGFMLAHYNRGLAHIQLRNPAAVFQAAEQVAKLAGDGSFEARFLFASAHALSGENEETRDILEAAEIDGGQFYAAWISSIYLMMGDVDAALDRLEQGLKDRSPDMVTIAEPKFDELRDHPRFAAIVREMGLPSAD